MKKIFLAKKICVFLTVFFLCFITIHRADFSFAAEGNGKKTISMDFKSVDIHVLIKFISEITGKNFITDRAVGGRVTIYSPTKVTVDEAYKVFESVLGVYGFVIVKSGSVYKILPAATAKNSNIPTKISKGGLDAAGDHVITQIISLKNSNADELKPVIDAMLGQQGVATVYKSTNTIILTSTASNIKRVLSVINEVDKSQYAVQTRNIMLENADSNTVASAISKIISASIKETEKGGKTGVALVVSDERTNSIFAYADVKNMIIIEEMIKSLDIPTPKGTGSIHVYNLKNADATSIAKVLNSLISGQTQKTDTKDKIVSGKVKIVADQSTNSLVITARQDDYAHLEETIRKMDIRRKQVYIEALIMEVSDTVDFEFGVNWVIPGRDGDVSAYASSNPGTGSSGISLSDAMAAFPSGGAVGALISDVIKVGDEKYSVQSLIRASASDDAFKILATPQLMTLDNQEARVDVVENIPYTTINTSSNTNINPDYNSQSISYKDVGVKLNVTPQIGIADSLRLKVKQEVSRVASSFVETGGTKILAPTTRKREVETVIQVLDGQTVVIAGLLGEDEVVNESKVPLLGDIPGLGWLFKYKKSEKVKTNLFVFLTPIVVDTFEESSGIYHEKREVMYDLEIGSDGLGVPTLIKPHFFEPLVYN